MKFLLLSRIDHLKRVISKLETVIDLQVQMRLSPSNTYRLLQIQRGKLTETQSSLSLHDQTVPDFLHHLRQPPLDGAAD